MQIPEPIQESDQEKPLRSIVFMALAAAVVLFLVSKSTEQPPPPPLTATPTPPGDRAAVAPDLRRGEELARKVCANCHLYPEPALLDRVTWGMEVLPDMAVWLGMGLNDQDPYDYLGLSPRARDAGVIPDEPMIRLEDWRAICQFYLDAAPSVPGKQADRSTIETELPGFELTLPRFRGNPRTTLVRIDPAQRSIILGSLGEDHSGTLDIFTHEAVRERGLRLPTPPVAVTIEKDRLVATLIGDYGPSDELNGKVVQIPQPGSTGIEMRDLISDLPRATDTTMADLNGDGRTDLLVCAYGDMLGKLAWFENLGDNGYKERLLFARNGVLAARTLDWNQDGRVDIIVMIAQQREGVYLLTNLDGGDFEARALIEKHPAWGFASFDLADMNGDGHLDIITANGDNGDFTGHIPPTKSYHGYRIYLNNGDFQFTEAWSFPVNGAFKVRARDFDNDGDQDLAAVSFYADYRNSPEEGFILFDNLGGEQGFIPRTFPDSHIGRWITFDLDDLDGDGDTDIVLGSFGAAPENVPAEIREGWKTNGPPFVILRNLAAD